MFGRGMMVMSMDAEGNRKVQKIVEAPGTHYVVTEPRTSHFGTVFNGWTEPTLVPKNKIERTFKPMDRELVTRYENIQKGQPTVHLYPERRT